MKKLFSLLTVILCVSLLSMSFSAAGTDAVSIYNTASKKMLQPGSYEIKGSLTGKIDLNGNSVEYAKSTLNVKVIVTKDNKIQMASSASDFDSGELKYAYYKDGIWYDTTTKTKVKLGVQDALLEATAMNWALKKEKLQDPSVEKVDGQTRIKFKTNFKDFSTPLSGNMMSSFQESDYDLKFSNIGNSITVSKDGSLSAYAMAFVVTMTDPSLPDDKTAKIKMNISGKVVNKNKLTSINFPKDLNTYKSGVIVN